MQRMVSILYMVLVSSIDGSKMMNSKLESRLESSSMKADLGIKVLVLELPSSQPTSQPSLLPSNYPTSEPSSQPSVQPSIQPRSFPSSQPTRQPTEQPSRQPSAQPTRQPTAQPTCQPTGQPSTQPTDQPSKQPSSQPSTQPSSQPSAQPSSQPSMQPTGQPSTQPSRQPSVHPSSQPTSQPSSTPTGQPSSMPSGQPSVQPTEQPSQPTNQPSSMPTTVTLSSERSRLDTTSAQVSKYWWVIMLAVVFISIGIYLRMLVVRRMKGGRHHSTSVDGLRRNHRVIMRPRDTVRPHRLGEYSPTQDTFVCSKHRNTFDDMESDAAGECKSPINAPSKISDLTIDTAFLRIDELELGYAPPLTTYRPQRYPLSPHSPISRKLPLSVHSDASTDSMHNENACTLPGMWKLNGDECADGRKINEVFPAKETSFDLNDDHGAMAACNSGLGVEGGCLCMVCCPATSTSLDGSIRAAPRPSQTNKPKSDSRSADFYLKLHEAKSLL